jgi:UDP-N-acetylmuramoylalanine--D-glutamate ligase
MKLDALKGKKILIVGYGVEGQSTKRFLDAHVSGASIAIADQKEGSDYLRNQRNYDIAIRSPSVPSNILTIPYTTATNIFFANTKGMVIGVTGTKGKSTTTSLIYDILKTAKKRVHLCGNIGKPLLDEFRVGRDRNDIYVAELSSYQLDDIQFSPHISVFINIFPEHMNYHGSIQNYIAAKKHIVQFATSRDYFVYNHAYSQLVQFAKESKAKPVPFVQTLPFPDSQIPLLGAHNRDNVRAAVTVGTILGVAAETMRIAVKHFKPLPHRLENIGTYKGITFYDDAISTTPESTIIAIECLKPIGTILVGGLDRGYDFNHLVNVIIRHGLKNVIYFPDTGNKIAALLKGKSRSISLFSAQNMDQAVKLSFQHTQKGTICLLSCASPSYSLWKNFEEKGDLFQRFIKQYAAL